MRFPIYTEQILVLVLLAAQGSVPSTQMGDIFARSSTSQTKGTEIIEEAKALKLVDARIIDSGPNEQIAFPKLDLLLRNPGPVAVLKRAVFHVNKVWEWKTTWRPSAVSSSWEYTVELPVRDTSYDLSVDIAQEVPAGGTDRFMFILGNDAPPVLNYYVFSCRVELIYNENNQTLSTPNILFVASPPIDVGAASSWGDPDVRIDTVSHNIFIVKEIGEFEGVISPTMQEWLSDWSRDITPDLIADLKQPEESQREFAAKFLGKLGLLAKAAVPELERVATEDKSQNVRNAAKVAVQLIKTAKETLDPVMLDANFANKYGRKPGSGVPRQDDTRLKKPVIHTSTKGQ